jgi:Fe2+ transport system protein FeoA
MELRLTELRDGEGGIITSIKASQGGGWARARAKFELKKKGVPFKVGKLRARWSDAHAHRRAGRGWGLKKRLEDMGLTPGTKITVVKSAPFRGPLEVHVRGSRLAIGKGMAERIFVEVKR